jgi:hypothetical protein
MPKVMEWESLRDFDFKKNCVFIDETGSNLHITKSFGRSIRGTPGKRHYPADGRISIIIFGAISEAGVIDIG